MAGENYSTFFRMIEGLPGGVVDQAKVLWYLFNDKRVHPVVKAVPVVAVALAGAAWKFKWGDFIPDGLPFGKVDNLGVSAGIILLGLGLMNELAPAEAVVEARQNVEQQRSARSTAFKRKSGKGNVQTEGGNDAGGDLFDKIVS